jgi:ATP adenylyltransferase
MIEYWIWTDRMKWIKRRKTKKCFFCEAAKLGRKTKRLNILYKSKNVLVLMNSYPYNTGHLLVAPTKHITDFGRLSNEEIKEIFVIVKKCLKILKRALKPSGFNIGLNIGKFSGASIEDHLHIHIVPRFKTDFGFIEVVSKTKVMPEYLKKTYERLMKYKKIFYED